MMNKKTFSLLLLLIVLSSSLNKNSLPHVEAAPTKQISHTGTNSGSYGAYYGTAWQEQSFTVGDTGFEVTSVKLQLWRTSASLGTATASIRAVDGNHDPTGSDLASGTYPCDDITQSEIAGTLYEFVFDTPYVLSPNTEYAIVLRQSAGDPAATLYWVYTHVDYTPGYAGGEPKPSTDSGSTWGDTINRDTCFEVWGEEATPPETTTATADTTTLVTTLVTTRTTLTPGTSTIDTTLTGGTTTITTCTTLEGPNGTTVSVIISQIVTNTISSLYSITDLAAGTVTGFETTCLTSTSVYETSTTTCSTYKTSITTCSTFQTTTTSCTTSISTNDTCTTTCSTEETIIETCTTSCSTFETCTTSCATTESVTTTCTTTCSTDENTVTSLITTCTTNTKVVGSTTTTTTTSGSGAIGGDTNILMLPLTIGAILTVLFVALGRRRK